MTRGSRFATIVFACACLVGVEQVATGRDPATGAIHTFVTLRVDHYVLQAGSGPGLSNLFVGDLGSTLTLPAPGVPHGVYYVRVIAKNACGSSGVSNEIVVVV